MSNEMEIEIVDEVVADTTPEPTEVVAPEEVHQEAGAEAPASAISVRGVSWYDAG